MYRLLLQPAYGAPAPEARKPVPELMDFSNPTVSRKRLHAEVFAGIVQEMRNTFCYDEITKIVSEDLTVLSFDGVPIALRLYRPQAAGPRPVIYFMHGGGYTANDLNIYDYVCRYLCRYAEALVCAVDYRLAPEHKCPVGREDCYAALLWLSAHAAQYGGDPARLSVCGDSAGGQLAAAMALMARDRSGPSIEKQLLIYPVTAFALDAPTESQRRYAALDPGGSVEEIAAVYFDDPADQYDPYNAPLLCESLQALPPAYFYAAECDPLLDLGLMYAARLQDAGIPVAYHLYEGMLHGFVNRSYQKTFACLNQLCQDVHAAP